MCIDDKVLVFGIKRHKILFTIALVRRVELVNKVQGKGFTVGKFALVIGKNRDKGEQKESGSQH